MSVKTKSSIMIPSSIWEQTDKQEHIVAIRMDDGIVISRIYVNKRGEIMGRVVGGQDGLEDIDFDLRSSQIVGIRYLDGIWGAMRLTKWIELNR